MNISLSPRLQACYQFIRQGERVADIGCDHGYLGISLIKNNVASSVIAADIRKMPLESAIKNAERFGVKDKMSFFLSDGVENIPHDFDVLVCAGIGGDTMVAILDNAPWLKSKQYRLVLQCQTRVHTLRKYLSDNNWRIESEILVRDGKFIYSVMEVTFGADIPLTQGQCYFPAALFVNPKDILESYYRFVVKGVKNTAKHQDNSLVLAELNEIGKRLDIKEEYDD